MRDDKKMAVETRRMKKKKKERRRMKDRNELSRKRIEA